MEMQFELKCLVIDLILLLFAFVYFITFYSNTFAKTTLLQQINKYNAFIIYQKQSSDYMDKFITEKLNYKCKQHERGCNWTGAINDYTRTVSQ